MRETRQITNGTLIFSHDSGSFLLEGLGCLACSHWDLRSFRLRGSNLPQEAALSGRGLSQEDVCHRFVGRKRRSVGKIHSSMEGMAQWRKTSAFLGLVGCLVLVGFLGLVGFRGFLAFRGELAEVDELLLLPGLICSALLTTKPARPKALVV